MCMCGMGKKTLRKRGWFSKTRGVILGSICAPRRDISASTVQGKMKDLPLSWNRTLQDYVIYYMFIRTFGSFCRSPFQKCLVTYDRLLVQNVWGNRGGPPKYVRLFISEELI